MTETEQIVAWLRDEADELDRVAGHYGQRGVWYVAADYDRQSKLFRRIKGQIERGDHLTHKDEDDGTA